MAKLYSAWTAVLLSLTLGACNPQTAQTADQTSASSPSSEAVTDPSESASPAPLQPKVELGTVQRLEMGDRACFVEVLGAGGHLSQQFAEFEVCYDSALVGQPARLFYQPKGIPAASCQGDPECRDLEMVLLIVAAELTETPTTTAQAPAIPPTAPKPVAQAPVSTPAPTSVPRSPAPRGDYMGIAATGEEVYYNGVNFQCGDLPPLAIAAGLVPMLAIPLAMTKSLVLLTVRPWYSPRPGLGQS